MKRNVDGSELVYGVLEAAEVVESFLRRIELPTGGGIERGHDGARFLELVALDQPAHQIVKNPTLVLLIREQICARLV